VLDTLAYLASGRCPVDARHQQLVVVGVDVPDRCCNGEVNGVGVKGPRGRASPDPATAARCRVTRYPVGPAGGTAREQVADCGGELGLEPHVV
jgi:hypothetical protein